MAVRRGRRVGKGPAQRVGSSKVVKVASPVVWERLLSKLAPDKLLVIHFSAVWSQPSARLRLYFTDLAKRPQYSHVMFAEIDVDHMTDLAHGLGVEACPTVVCWKDGDCIERTAKGQGGNPASIEAMIDRHAGPKPEGPRWRSALKKVAIVAAAAAVTGFAYQQVQQRQQPQNPSSKAAQLDRKMQTVNGSLAEARRRRHSKLVDELEQQLLKLRRERREVEDMLHAAVRDAVPAQPQPQCSSSTAAASGHSSGGYTSEEEDLAAFSDEDEA